MSRFNVEEKPNYVMGGILALAGLVLSWLLGSLFPPKVATLVIGALIGGFGVAAAGRIWPGLPMNKIHIYGLSMAVYGAVCNLLGSF
ncbi:hypothetical protein [Palleronia caenipelagi]|uniref:Uncharacterized protein n=1 Tax=Palleronia caenipelagi TaxID=2489174 RepID=A0A547Q7A5_9RHOB|nr:hypothetical protein [Palleronia caenipelagi]TRD22262.1 hypothetical protein FEV53_05955 [Palleronia caenipelagi]